MSTKRILTVLIFASLAFVVGCSGEEEPYHDVPVVELKGASCLSKVSGKVEKFYQGVSSKNETNEIWNCFSFAVSTFQSYVKGQEKGSYTADELRNFLETYFIDKNTKRKFKGHAISDGLLEELMALKKVLLGGSPTLVSGPELTRCLALIETLRASSLKLLPHAKYLFAKKGTPNSAQFAAAASALQTAIQTLISMVHPQDSRYEFARFERLLIEVQEFTNNTDSSQEVSVAAPYVKTFGYIKGILLNSQREVIMPNEWADMGKVLGQAYVTFLRLSFFVDPQSFFSAERTREIQKSLGDVIQIFRDAFVRRQNRAIANSELDPIWGELAKMGSLPFAMTFEDIHGIWVKLVDFILNPQNRFASSGLSHEKIEYFENEVGSWARVQVALLEKRPLPDESGWVEMQKILAAPWPQSLDVSGRVVIDGRAGLETNIQGQSRLNWARVVFRVLFQAYVQDQNRREVKREMTKNELRRMFLDLRPALAGLGLVDKDDDKFDQQLFRDANLFMPRADGDKELDFVEAIEYVHFVFAGISGGKYFISKTLPKCRLNDDEKMLADCFRTTFRNGRYAHFEHLPLYLTYTEKLSDKDWRKDIKRIETTVRPEGPTATPIAYKDIYEAFVMLQYIETLMLRFDTDRSGDIDLIEGIKALDHFKNVLGDIFGLDPSRASDYDDMEVLFTYMLKNGAMPDPDDPLAQLKLNNWRWGKSGWRLAADRGILLQILATISKLGSN